MTGNVRPLVTRYVGHPSTGFREVLPVRHEVHPDEVEVVWNGTASTAFPALTGWHLAGCLVVAHEHAATLARGGRRETLRAALSLALAVHSLNAAHDVDASTLADVWRLDDDRADALTECHARALDALGLTLDAGRHRAGLDDVDDVHLDALAGVDGSCACEACALVRRHLPALLP